MLAARVEHAAAEREAASVALYEERERVQACAEVGIGASLSAHVRVPAAFDVGAFA